MVVSNHFYDNLSKKSLSGILLWPIDISCRLLRGTKIFIKKKNFLTKTESNPFILTALASLAKIQIFPLPGSFRELFD